MNSLIDNISIYIIICNIYYIIISEKIYKIIENLSFTIIRSNKIKELRNNIKEKDLSDSYINKSKKEIIII
jgi:hypothetical protein